MAQSHSQAQLLFAAGDLLGEGAFWHHEKNVLMRVDIENGLVYETNPSLKAVDTDIRNLNTYKMPAKVGTVVPAVGGGYVVGLQTGMWLLDASGTLLTLLAHPEANKPGNRFNDGKCDPVGRFWCGTMSMKEEPNAGALYSYTPNAGVKKVLGNISISNGIAWSADATKMYYIDTPTRKIFVFDYNINTGEISNGKTLVDFEEGAGYPDGMTIDANGNLWVCMWAGASVRCHDAITGQLLHKITVPGALNITSCAFGGPDLDVLYITSARKGMEKADPAGTKYPHAGGVFYAHPGVKGVKLPFYRP